MKKALIITISLLIFAAGFLAYNHYFQQGSVDKWDLIPEETVLVYETSECQQCLSTVAASPVAKVIRSAAFRAVPNDTLNSVQNFLLSFHQPTLVSLHVVKKDEFDFAYYASYSAGFKQKIDILLRQLESVKGIHATKRILDEIQINEVSWAQRTFSWIVVDGVWVGSYSPILIEDIIRTYRSKEKSSFKSAINSVYQLPRIKNDGGNLYVHLTNLSKLLGLFTNKPAGRLINRFAHSSLLDIKVENGQLVLNGFSYHPAGKPMFLSAFQEQSPVEFTLRNLVSNRTLMISDYGVSDGGRFFSRISQIIKNPDADSVALLADRAKIQDGFFNGFSGEVTTCAVESSKDKLTNILLLRDNKDPEFWFKKFTAVAKAFTTDTLFVDHYSGYQIYEVPVPRFSSILFHPIVSGFDNNYFVQVGNTLCVGEEIEELKRFLDDVDQENTWGKSVAQNRFLESTLLESNVSIFINVPRIWYLLSGNLQPKWQAFLEENKRTLDQLGMASFQFSHLNDTYYTNIAFGFKEASSEPAPAVANKYVSNLESNIARFITARSHVDRSTELFVQDSSKNIALLSEEGKVLWQMPLPEFIQGEIHQIDFFNNGKLQFLFATPGMIHVVDRLGNYVKPYPVSISEKNIDHLSVIDYDHSRKYRFLISSTDGNLWMYDKDGKNLEGWQPRAVDERLIGPVNHHRIHGRDYLIAIRKDGVVFLMNRRGELVKNFPLDLNARLEGDYYLDIGKRTSDTYFTVMSTDGVKYKFNLNGRVDSQDAMVKNTIDAKFSLVSEDRFKSFLVLRREAKQFTVFDASLNEIIASDYIANNPVDVEYYSFGNGRDYIVVTDLSQDLSFIYDKKGKLLTSIPFDTNNLRITAGDGDKLKVYYSQDKSVIITTVP